MWKIGFAGISSGQNVKLLIVTNMYPTAHFPYYGIFIKEHVEALRSLNVQVDVFFTNARKNRLSYFVELPRLARWLKFNTYNVIHAVHTYCVFQLKLLRLLISFEIPIIFTMHEGEAFLRSKGLFADGDFLKSFVYSKRLKRLASNLVDRLIVVERRLPKEIGYLGNYEVIPPGVDLGLFIPLDMKESRKKLNLSLNKKLLLFPADPKHKFNKGYELLEQSLNHLKFPVQIVSAGSIRHKDMPIFINAVDVVVLASRFEASPMVVKETMACNRPMVVTDVGDVRELIGDTEGYFICERDPLDIAEKIDQALEFGSLTLGRKRLTQLGLSTEQIAQKYLNIFLESYS